MNFIREEETRYSTDLIQPVRDQIVLIKEREFPATWQLQDDVLAEGPFVDFLKAEMPSASLTCTSFEMNRKICENAGIAGTNRADSKRRQLVIVWSPSLLSLRRIKSQAGFGGPVDLNRRVVEIVVVKASDFQRKPRKPTGPWQLIHSK